MPPHIAFFWGTACFLLGVLLKSFFSGTIVILASAGIFIILSLYSLIPSFVKTSADRRANKRIVGFTFFLLPFLLILGGFYYSFYDSLTRPQTIPFGEEITIQGRVIKSESRLAVQNINLRISEPFKGNIRATVSPLPKIRYGDEIALSGKLERPEEGSYERYLKKDNIFAVMTFPAIDINLDIQQFHLPAQTNGIVEWRKVRGFLYAVSDRVQETFSQLFPAREAALMSGLTLGNTSKFTKEFKEAMQRTGTTHIVALSGYNVMIIVTSAMALFGYFMSRRGARFCALVLIIFFVLLTGAESSVVRAAIMAFLFMYLTAGGRMKDTKNVVVITALVMILINPRILAYDVGFQLSFLAFLGIVYIAPHVEEKLKRQTEKKVGIFKKALAYTVSAQLMTLPLLIGYFDRVFISSIVPNVLVVALLPPTMALGFLTALLSFIFPLSSYIFGFLAFSLLRLETFIIEFFSHIAFLPISFNAGIVFAILYYALLVKILSKEKEV